MLIEVKQQAKKEKNGQGKLKSGAGWICLSYTEKTGQKSTTTKTAQYLKRYTGKSGSIAEALRSIGVDSSYAYRGKIASKKGKKWIGKIKKWCRLDLFVLY